MADDKVNRLEELTKQLEAMQVEFESRIAYQENAINQLSDSVYQQQREIEHLTALTKHLAAQLRSLSDGSGEIADEQLDNQPPPHY